MNSWDVFEFQKDCQNAWGIFEISIDDKYR